MALRKCLIRLARPAGIEPATNGLEVANPTIDGQHWQALGMGKQRLTRGRVFHGFVDHCSFLRLSVPKVSHGRYGNIRPADTPLDSRRTRFVLLARALAIAVGLFLYGNVCPQLVGTRSLSVFGIPTCDSLRFRFASVFTHHDCHPAWAGGDPASPSMSPCCKSPPRYADRGLILLAGKAHGPGLQSERSKPHLSRRVVAGCMGRCSGRSLEAYRDIHGMAGR